MPATAPSKALGANPSLTGHGCITSCYRNGVECLRDLLDLARRTDGQAIERRRRVGSARRWDLRAAARTKLWPA